jgi:MFS family permease
VTDAARTRRRAFAALLALGIMNHVALTGARVDVSLDALARGASPATVGLLIALFAMLPMVFAVAIGRYSDRVGAGTPMLAGSTGLAASIALPALAPGFPALFASAALAGLSFTMFQVALQHVTGEMGDPAKRVKRFSLLALAFSVSGIVGPLVTGFAIDYAGHRAAFALLAVVPLAPLVVLLSRRIPLPAPAAHEERASRRGMLDLVRHRPMRRLLALNALFALGWDLHTVFVPIVGAELGLSASQIGAVLAAFGLATFVVRLALPWVASRASETQVLAAALFLSAGAYVGFPFATGAGMLAMLSFTLGLGLGGGQPVMMSLLATRAPPGRMGEVAGLRMSLIQTMAVAAPLAFGALGTTLGLLPVFWGVGACLVTGGVVARRGA